MTVETWYWRTWSRADHTPENWAKVKTEARAPEQVADLYSRPEGLTTTALISGIGDSLPSYQITINTSTTLFSVQQLRADTNTAYRATFHIASAYADVDGGWYDGFDSTVALQHPGEHFLYSVRGPLPPHGDAQETILTAQIRPGGEVRTETRVAFSQEAPATIGFSPWPGLGVSESDWLWTDYPDFNEYDELIDKALKAFDFFLSSPDPRLLPVPNEGQQ